MSEQYEELRKAAEAATPQNFDSAPLGGDSDGWIDCPTCGGEGSVEITADYCNYDAAALGVQFYGIGSEHGAAERYYRAANPAAIIALLDERDALRDELAATTAERNAWAQKCGKDAREIKALNAELQALKDYQPTDDVIARAKRVMAAVDIYHDRPDGGNRFGLRSILMDELQGCGGPAPAAAVPAVDAMTYPDEMTDAVREVLSMMCFEFIDLARLYRDSGFAINKRAEDEQSFFLHRLTKLALAHGDQWRKAFAAELKPLVDARKAAAASQVAGGDASLPGLLESDRPALGDVDQLISSSAVGADKVDAERVDSRLNGVKSYIDTTADAFPHGSLPTNGDSKASISNSSRGDA